MFKAGPGGNTCNLGTKEEDTGWSLGLTAPPVWPTEWALGPNEKHYLKQGEWLPSYVTKDLPIASACTYAGMHLNLHTHMHLHAWIHTHVSVLLNSRTTLIHLMCIVCICVYKYKNMCGPNYIFRCLCMCVHVKAWVLHWLYPTLLRQELSVGPRTHGFSLSSYSLLQESCLCFFHAGITGSLPCPLEFTGMLGFRI